MMVAGKKSKSASPASLKSPRRRHSLDFGDAATVCRCHHWPYQSELPIAHRLPGGKAAWTLAPSSISRAPKTCSVWATCSSRPRTGAATHPWRTHHRRRSPSRRRASEAVWQADLRHGHPQAAWRRRTRRRRGRSCRRAIRPGGPHRVRGSTDFDLDAPAQNAHRAGNRSARMIERMERDSIVGPADGPKRRSRSPHSQPLTITSGSGSIALPVNRAPPAKTILSATGPALRLAHHDSGRVRP